jgi:hypothetical protein
MKTHLVPDVVGIPPQGNELAFRDEHELVFNWRGKVGFLKLLKESRVPLVEVSLFS